MQEGNHNQNILLSEDDADTLALLIASYYYQLDISIFFKDNGINLEDIFKLLNINILEEEIMSIELDVALMINKFGRFVTNGVNSNSTDITMNTISQLNVPEELMQALTNDVQSFVSNLEEPQK